MLRNLKVFAFLLVLAVFICAAPQPPTSLTNSLKKKCLETCPTTKDYNPFCGTDGETYSTYSKLNCFKKCDLDISVAYRGRCVHQNPDEIGTQNHLGFEAQYEDSDV